LVNMLPAIEQRRRACFSIFAPTDQVGGCVYNRVLADPGTSPGLHPAGCVLYIVSRAGSRFPGKQ
jgi:hypothetical protein